MHSRSSRLDPGEKQFLFDTVVKKKYKNIFLNILGCLKILGYLFFFFLVFSHIYGLEPLISFQCYLIFFLFQSCIEEAYFLKYHITDSCMIIEYHHSVMRKCKQNGAWAGAVSYLIFKCCWYIHVPRPSHLGRTPPPCY